MLSVSEEQVSRISLYSQIQVYQSQKFIQNSYQCVTLEMIAQIG